MTTDFADWEKLGAELPQLFTATPVSNIPPVPPGTPSGNEEEVIKIREIQIVIHNFLHFSIGYTDDSRGNQT